MFDPSSIGREISYAGLIRQGRKVTCPLCERRVMSQGDIPFQSSGIGQHMRKCHPEHYDAAYSTGRRLMREAFQRELATKHELEQRPHRTHVVTGALLIEIVGEVQSLVAMMEPYYSQCNADRPACELIERLQTIIATKN